MTPQSITAIATATIAVILIGWTIYGIGKIETQNNVMSQMEKEARFMNCVTQTIDQPTMIDECFIYLR